jgi:hypothetical protein
MAKSPLAKFAYNNNVYNTTNISPFFAIYGFHLNILLSVKDDYLERKISAARKRQKNLNTKIKSWRNDSGTLSIFRKSDIIKSIPLCIFLIKD